MDSRRLYLGLVLLALGHTILHVLFANEIEYFIGMQAVEAVLFSSVILVALKDTHLLHWLLLLPLAAALNFVAFMALPVLVSFMMLFHLLGFEKGWGEFLGWGAYVSLCAVVYGVLLQLLVRPVFMRAGTYGWLAVAGFVAVIPPLVFLELNRFEWLGLALHKVSWFCLVGLTLLAASRRHEQARRRITA